MGKYSDAIFQQIEATPEAPVPGKYSSQLLGAGETSYSGALSETATGRSAAPAFQAPIEGRGVGFAGSLKAGMVEDPQTKLRLLAESKFPNDPEAIKRFGYRDGNPVFVNNQGQLERADTGFASTAGSVLSSTPEMIGSIIGSAATGNPFSGSAIGAAGGKGFKQIVSGLLFDEPQTTGGNVAGMLGEGALDAAGSGVGKVISAGINRAAVRNADKFDLPGTQDKIKQVKDATGIELDFAQAGNIRQLRDLKKWASKYPSDAQEIIEALDQKQADQISNAIRNKLLPKISSKTDDVEMAQSGIDGAKAAINLAKQRRTMDTKQLYVDAEKDLLDGPKANVLRDDPFLAKHLEGVLKNDLYRGEMAGLGLLGSKGSATNASSAAGGTADRSIKAWDLVLREIRDAEDVAIRAGENNKARLLNGKASKLEAELTAASPKYAQARAAWEKASDEYVNPLEKGVVGLIAKIDSPTIASDAARLMETDVLSNPNTAAKVRGALKNSGNPGAWNDLLRLSLEKAFQKAAKETQGGDAVNVAGKFRQALIGTPQQKVAMDVAVGSGVHQLFGDVMGALQMVAKEQRSRGGSDTFANQAITEQQKGGALGAAVKSVAAPIKSVVGAIDDRMLANNAKAFAEALTDPVKLAKLKELRALKPSQERSLAILSTIGIGEPLESAADVITAPTDTAIQPPRNALAGQNQNALAR